MKMYLYLTIINLFSQVYHTQYEQSTDHDASDLPTHENYPDDAHTRVIYHSPRGHFRDSSLNFASVNRNYLPVSNTQPHYAGYKDVQDLKPPVQTGYDYPAQQGNVITYPKAITPAPAAPAAQYEYQQKVSPDLNTIYMDQNGQKYIYVLPGQAGYPQEGYGQNQVYYQQQQQQPEYVYNEEAHQVQTEAPFNYHAYEAKNSRERNKKSSGSPVTFANEGNRSKNQKS